MPRHAFVSYSRTDSVYVEQLIGWLGDRSVPIWSDAGLEYGAQWPAVVREAVDNAGAVVVVMSPDAESSEWVDRELARAELKSRPVLPLLLVGDPFFRLGSTHYEDVRGGLMPRDAFVRRLVELCDSALPPPDGSLAPILIQDGGHDPYERVEPLEAHLAALLRSMIGRPDDPFLILERPGYPTYYAQVAANEDGSFQVEYRDGGPEHHYGATADDADLVADVLAGWVDRIDGWDAQLQWERLELS